MTKRNKFGSWRDERESEFEKAEKLITDKNVDLSAVSRRLNIPYQTLKDYRQDFSKLNKARWEHINKLSQLADSFYVQDNMTEEDKIYFRGYLNIMFRDIAEIRDKDDVPVINKLRNIILSDPLLLTELFKAKGLKKGYANKWLGY